MINEQIRDREVRLIGPDGAQLGIVSAREAMAKAQEAGQAVIHTLLSVPPFSRLDRKQFEEFLMQVFSEEAFTELNEYLQLPMEQQAVSNITGAHPLAALLVRVIPVLGHLS